MITSSGPQTLDNAISTLVPAVLRVLRKMKRWAWDAITPRPYRRASDPRRASVAPVTTAMEATGRDFRDDDWYGDRLGAARFTECTFTGVDFSECTTSGAVFDQCTFHACQFSSSTHTSTAFVACDVRRSKFFDVTLDGCKLVGTVSPSASCGR